MSEVEAAYYMLVWILLTAAVAALELRLASRITLECREVFEKMVGEAVSGLRREVPEGGWVEVRLPRLRLLDTPSRVLKIAGGRVVEP